MKKFNENLKICLLWIFVAGWGLDCSLSFANFLGFGGGGGGGRSPVPLKPLLLIVDVITKFISYFVLPHFAPPRSYSLATPLYERRSEDILYYKLDKNVIKKFTISTIYKFPHFSTKTYYFKEWTTILHYQQPNNLLFSTIYICPHFFYENLLFYITNILLTFLKMQRH